MPHPPKPGAKSTYPPSIVLHPDHVRRVLSYLRSCRNFDGGFGAVAGAESHASQVFVCTGALAILDALDDASVLDADTCAWWLAERQLPNGGLNGRPEKLEDVCYSFWVLSGLSILEKLHWINAEKLSAFILSAQVRPCVVRCLHY